MVEQIDFTWLQGITNFVSILMIVYFLKKTFLQTEEYLKKKWMIVGLLVSDCSMSIGYILIIGNAKQYYNSTWINLCVFQAFLIHYGMLCSFMWINCIVLAIYNSLYSKYVISRSKTTIICYLAPLAYTSL